MKNIQSHQTMANYKPISYGLLTPSELSRIDSNIKISKAEVLFSALFIISIIFILFSLILLDQLVALI